MTAKPRFTILLIDDSVDALSALLREEHAVFEARSGLAGLDIAIRRPQPHILLDVMMPEVDSYAVLARLKENPLTNQTERVQGAREGVASASTSATCRSGRPAMSRGCGRRCSITPTMR